MGIVALISPTLRSWTEVRLDTWLFAPIHYARLDAAGDGMSAADESARVDSITA